MKVFHILAVAAALTVAVVQPAQAVGLVVPPPPPPPAGGVGGGGGGGGAAAGVVIGCAGLIVLAALKHVRHRELTAQEAWTCGILGLLAPVGDPQTKPLKVRG